MAAPFIQPQRVVVPPVLVAVALLLVLVLPNPAGYVGAAGDDFHYVQAARCAAAASWCLPETHWAVRWPLVAPMGLVFRFFGDGWWQSTIVPLAYSLLAVVLFVRLVERTCGPRAAMLAGLVFVATAAFAKGLLQPNIETVELALVLAAANAGERAWQSRRARWAVAAGLMLGIAAQARMTTLVWLPIGGIALLLVARDAWRLALPIVAGFALPLSLEALIYGVWAGRPLLSQQLSAAHTRIASSELPATVDLTRSPLFNPQFIGGWRPAMDVHVHWTVDGVLNLLANPQIGPVLIVALMLLWLRRKALSWRDPAVVAAFAAMLYAGALIYGLAIDPKARMFLPVAALAALIAGRCGVAAWDAGERSIVAGLVALAVMFGAIETDKRFDMGVAAPLAGEWVRAYRGDIAVEDATRRFLTFDPTVMTLPVAPTQARHLLVLVAGHCREAQDVAAAPADWTLVKSRYFGRTNDPLNLCVFRRAQPT